MREVKMEGKRGKGTEEAGIDQERCIEDGWGFMRGERGGGQERRGEEMRGGRREEHRALLEGS